MLSDPQSITIGGTAHSLPRVSTSSNESTYMKDDGTVKLTIKHQYGAKRNRRLISVYQKKISSDPLVTANNAEYWVKANLVLDEPTTVGYTSTERKDLLVGLAGWLTASTNANSIAFVGGQS